MPYTEVDAKCDKQVTVVGLLLTTLGNARCATAMTASCQSYSV